MDKNFRIGSWLVKPWPGQIIGRGTVTRVKPMIMRLLVYLADHCGRTVSKKELVENVWDNIHVSDDALTHAIFELRKILNDNAKDPKIIATVPKKGYRLIAPVLKEHHYKPLPKVIVLPFQGGSISGQAYESITGIVYQALVAELVKSEAVKVVSGFCFASLYAKKESLVEVAHELNISVFMEGSVFVLSEEALWISINIVDAEGKYLWAEIFEEKLQSFFPGNLSQLAPIVREVERAATTNDGVAHSSVEE